MPTERRGRSTVKIVLVLSILLNIGLFYWTFTLGAQVNSLVRENQKLAVDLSGLKQESEILNNQLAYYKAQADYYSRLYQTGSSHQGLVGKSSVNMVAVQQIQRTIFTASYK